jgi:hypothetical protein
MKSTITISSLKFIQDIKDRDTLFNQLNSHIIKDYCAQSPIKLNIFYDKNNFYYIINLNNFKYIGRIQSNELNINIFTNI